VGGTLQIPRPDDIWKESLGRVYGKDAMRWQQSDEWGQAKMLAQADKAGTGDLLSEAVRQVPVESGPAKGGVDRLLGMLKGGGNEQRSDQEQG
jgi:hypothetical protein